MKPLSKPIIIPFVVMGICVLIAELLKQHTEAIEKIYSRGIYPTLSKGLNGVMRLFPFSVFEWICVLIALLILGLLVLAVVLHIKGHRESVHLGTAVLRGLTVAFGVILIYNALWGFNYYRQPLAKSLNYRVNKHSKEELKALCFVLVEETSKLSKNVKRDSKGVMIKNGGVKSVLERAPRGYHILGTQEELFNIDYASPKPVFFSRVMTLGGISGMYSPFTAESQINGEIPAPFLPATAMHELAHLYGFAREDEANFLAWLSCKTHPDPDYKYSGALLGLIYSMDALYQVDPEGYKLIKDKYALGIKADLAYNNKFWTKYEGSLSRLHDKINDRYLKANGQKEGTNSYGRMVDLLLAAYPTIKKNKIS